MSESRRRSDADVVAGGDGHTATGGVVVDRVVESIAIPPWLVLVVLLLIVAAVGGAAFVAGRSTKAVAAPAPVVLAEEAPFFLDAVLVGAQDGLRLWSVRWLLYGQTRAVTVEGDGAKDRLVAYLRDGKR